MTISKKAVAAFLDRELDDFTFLKQWRREDLLEELRNLPVRPRITSPHRHWHHQLVTLLLCCLFDSWLLFLDVGSGKTRILLETFAYKRRLGEASCALSVSLNDVNAYNWYDDASVHTPQYKVQLLEGSAERRWEDFYNTDAHIYATSYAGLRAMLGKRVSNKKHRGKEKIVVDPARIRELCRYIDFVAYDEIHKCKNTKSVTYSICRNISRNVPFRYGATGTAFGRDAEDLWAEFFLCDLGETLGTTLGIFREAFFNETIGFGGWRNYVLDKRTKDIFRQTLKHKSIYYKDSEIGDMPKKVPRIIKLRPPESLQEYYNKALEKLQQAVRNEDLENNWIRLRMICSGFVSYQGEDSEKIKLLLPDNPKIEALESFVEEVPLDRKGIIVHEFVASGLIIEKTLTEMGIEFCCLNGRIKNKKEVYRTFRTDPFPRFLIMNWKSGGTGGNYQVAPYMHFYESPVSPIERKQTEGRVRRRDSKVKRIYYTDPIIQGSVEQDILDFLKEGKDLYQDLMGNKERIRRIKKI